MFKVMDAISKFEDLSVEKLKKIRDGFDVCKDDKRILFFYWIAQQISLWAMVTYCINVSKKLTVELYYKKLPNASTRMVP